MIRAQQGGIRIRGREYPSGMELPTRYRKQLQGTTRPVDPGHGITNSVPNLGRMAVPHVVTFRGMVTSLSRAYRDSDEALRHSTENAHAMLNDPVVAGPLFSRQMMTALLNWSIETENDKDPRLKRLGQELTEIIKHTPNFTEFRRYLMEASWYGRVAIQNAYGVYHKSDGSRYRFIRKWAPVSGDKLLFRYDDGTGSYDPDQVGIRMSPAVMKHDYLAGKRELEATGEGLGYFLQPWERRMWVLHRHMVRDGEFEDPISGGQIHGVGLRHFLYWVWYQKQETLAQMVELIDRTGMGFTIYFYPEGNPAARDEVEKVSSEQAHTNRILMPASDTDQYRVEQIPPNTAGLEALRGLIEDHFEGMIIRFILGQTLSSKPSATGMNTGVADLQKDTLNHIIRYDAVKLEETITKECLHFLRDINFPKYRNVEMWFRISTKSSAPEEELSALMQMWQMGARLKASDIFDRLDLSMPDKDDKQLFNPSIAAQIEQLEQQEQQGTSIGDAMMVGVPQDADGDGIAGEGTDAAQLDSEPVQMDKEEEENREKERIFGPIIYRKGAQKISSLKKAGTTPPATVIEIAEAISRLAPPSDPGYGQVFYNPETKTAWVMLGDSDEREVYDTWKGAVKSISGVDTVKGESEVTPPEWGNGSPWIRIYRDMEIAYDNTKSKYRKIKYSEDSRVQKVKAKARELPSEGILDVWFDEESNSLYVNAGDWVGLDTVDAWKDAFRDYDFELLDEVSGDYGANRGMIHAIKYRKADSSELRRAISDAAEYTEKNPSDAQREAGNYKKGRFWFEGLEIAVETPRGSSRRPEWSALPCHYGYIKLTQSKDGDHLDVFIGPDHDSDLVVVVDQVTPGGRFDEHKVFLCCSSKRQAIELYKESYTPSWKVGPVTAMTIDQFKSWISDGNTKEPVHKQVSKYQKTAPRLSVDKLSPIFETSGELDSEVLDRLRKIAGDFISSTEIPREAVVDVQVTGSLAGYGWGTESDLDLHIVVDPEQILAPPDMLADYFYNVSANFNAKHAISIKGHEVEVFVEPMQEPAADMLAV